VEADAESAVLAGRLVAETARVLDDETADPIVEDDALEASLQKTSTSSMHNGGTK